MGNSHIYNSPSEKLLDINFNCKLKFNKHIEDTCQKPSWKLNALPRLALFVGVTKKLIHKHSHEFLWMSFLSHNSVIAH